MSCDYCQPQLTALADGELSSLTAWRVRQHLTRCAACATLYAEIVQVGVATRAFAQATAAPAPADLSAHVLHHLAQSPLPTANAQEVTGPVFDSQEVPMPVPATVLHHPFANLRFAPTLRSVAAATAVLIAAVGFGTHALVPGKPSVAFADVRRAVQQVSTAHIRYRITPQQAGEEINVFDAWLRTKPASFVMLMGEGVRLVGNETGTVIYPGEGNGKPIHVSDEKVTQATITGFLISPEELLTPKPGRPGQPPTQWSGPEWITRPDGARLLRFHTEKEGNRVTLLVDPETQRPAHLAVQTAAGETGQDSTLVEIDFTYNEPIPPGTF